MRRDGPRGSVLVIDDDEATRDVISRLLSREGFEVSTARDGAEGLRLAAMLRPDVITLDVIMPELGGWDVLAALKHDDELRDIPVVLLTMVDDRSKGIALGASEYLTKPIDGERLARVLDRFRREGPPRTVLMVDDDPAVLDHLGRSIRPGRTRRPGGSAHAEAGVLAFRAGSRDPRPRLQPCIPGRSEAVIELMRADLRLFGNRDGMPRGSNPRVRTARRSITLGSIVLLDVGVRLAPARGEP